MTKTVLDIRPELRQLTQSRCNLYAEKPHTSSCEPVSGSVSSSAIHPRTARDLHIPLCAASFEEGGAALARCTPFLDLTYKNVRTLFGAGGCMKVERCEGVSGSDLSRDGHEIGISRSNKSNRRKSSNRAELLWGRDVDLGSCWCVGWGGDDQICKLGRCVYWSCGNCGLGGDLCSNGYRSREITTQGTKTHQKKDNYLHPKSCAIKNDPHPRVPKKNFDSKARSENQRNSTPQKSLPRVVNRKWRPCGRVNEKQQGVSRFALARRVTELSTLDRVSLTPSAIGDSVTLAYKVAVKSAYSRGSANKLEIAEFKSIHKEASNVYGVASGRPPSGRSRLQHCW